MDKITSHKDLISRFGQPTNFSKAIGVPYNVTRKWSARDRIPADYWVRVVNACNDIDVAVTYRQLAEWIAK